MNNDDIYLKLEQLLNNTYFVVEVVSNSCCYKDDYASEFILNLAKDNLNEMLDIIYKVN